MRKWNKENVGIHGREIVANTILQAKLLHREIVNRLRSRMRRKITNAIKSFVSGEAENKARVNWDVMLKYPKEGGLGVRNPVSVTHAKKTQS